VLRTQWKTLQGSFILPHPVCHSEVPGRHHLYVVNCLFHVFSTACLEAVLCLSPDQQCRIHCQMICVIHLLTRNQKKILKIHLITGHYRVLVHYVWFMLSSSANWHLLITYLYYFTSQLPVHVDITYITSLFVYSSPFICFASVLSGIICHSEILDVELWFWSTAVRMASAEMTDRSLTSFHWPVCCRCQRLAAPFLTEPVIVMVVTIWKSCCLPPVKLSFNTDLFI